MDLKYQHQTLVHVVRACNYSDADDLVAVGGEHSVEVLRVTEKACESIAIFHLGCRVTAVAWSNHSLSPTYSDEWTLELTAATSDRVLHHLTKARSGSENVFRFGGGRSGHHAKVTDMVFCGGQNEDTTRYVATVSDDKMLMIWDLYPTLDIVSNGLVSSSRAQSEFPPRSQPTAYAIPFAHPLTSVCSHPSTSNDFLVSDSRGSVFLVDWRFDPEEDEGMANYTELIEPQTLADAASGAAKQWGGSVDWCRASADIVGAVHGTKFSIWDMSTLRGGKPSESGVAFSEGGQRFRWCQSYSEYFAISSASPSKGAMIHIFNTNYLNATPLPLAVAPRPHMVRDFDFVSSARMIPRLAVAVERSVVILPIGDMGS